ncbi:MAG TPA: diaminopimelate epimerase [Acidisarcina sp.]
MIQFAKTHAYGNDFLIVDSKTAEREGHRDLAIRICARHTGLGADGVEYLEWTAERAGRIRLFNADGSAAEISGNGTRCVAAWMAHETQSREGTQFAIETDAGVRVSTVVYAEGNRFEIASEMGVPSFKAKPLTLVDGSILSGVVISTGNPHYVIFADDADFNVSGRSWLEVGEEVCRHTEFPQQTNVEFVRVLSPKEIEIRIFERGVGPTSSSGTGTCACAVAAIMLREVDHDLLITAPGGTQRVEWTGPGTQIVLTGVAEIVAVGDIYPRQRALRLG